MRQENKVCNLCGSNDVYIKKLGLAYCRDCYIEVAYRILLPISDDKKIRKTFKRLERIWLVKNLRRIFSCNGVVDYDTLSTELGIDLCRINGFIANLSRAGILNRMSVNDKIYYTVNMERLGEVLWLEL